jgi:hypothetical protein
MHCIMTNGLPSQVSPNVGMGRSDRKFSIEFVNVSVCERKSYTCDHTIAYSNCFRNNIDPHAISRLGFTQENGKHFGVQGAISELQTKT